MLKRITAFYLLVLFIAFSIASEAKENNYFVVENLSDDWHVYDKNYQSYVPLLNKEIAIQSGGVFLQKNSTSDYYISFYSNKGLALFVDNKIIYKHPAKRESFRARLPLKSVHEQASQDRYLLLFHNANSIVYTDSLNLEVDRLSTNKEEDKGWVLSTLLRKGAFNKDVFIVLVFIFSALLIFYKFVFLKGRTLLNLGLDRNTELLLSDRSGMMSLTLILINGLLYTIIYYLLLEGGAVSFNFPFRVFFKSEPGLYVFYLFTSITLMQLLKVAYIRLINEITFSSGVSPLQNYLLLNYLFQAGLLILPILLVVMALLPLPYIVSIVSYASFLLFIILVIISLLTSYMIYSRSELRNIYLFSYICTAEIVPLIIAYRILLG